MVDICDNGSQTSTLCIMIFVSAVFPPFFKIFFFRNSIRLSNSLDPDQGLVWAQAVCRPLGGKEPIRLITDCTKRLNVLMRFCSLLNMPDNEQHHEKLNKRYVRSIKSQISLSIGMLCSEYLLSALWVAIMLYGFRLTAKTPIRLCEWRTCHFGGFS